MKILVVSNTPWNDSNSFGNSFSNIFDGIEDLQFANIYCRPGEMSNRFDMVGFQITESMLIKNLKNKSTPSGKIVHNNKADAVELSKTEQETFDKARTLRWQALFWARDLIWKIGKWKTPELVKFIDDFNPDLIFQPVYYSSHLNDIAQFVKKHTGARMVGYISDDCYTLRQFRFSPLYWVDRLWKRTKVKKTINMCEILYVISDIQKREYEKIFNPPCKILTKCADFPEKAFNSEINNGEIKIIYGGNIGSGRWKSLALISDAVVRLKAEGFSVRFDVYSGTPCTGSMKKALVKEDSCYLHEPITYKDLLKLQNDADILVHAEGLSLKSRLEVHQSFSTKLVDYFRMGKCIFAVGTSDVASIDHLLKNDAAVVAENKEQVYEKLKCLLENPEKILEYNKKAYLCGAKHHSREQIQNMIIKDLKNIISYK